MFSLKSKLMAIVAFGVVAQGFGYNEIGSSFTDVKVKSVRRTGNTVQFKIEAEGKPEKNEFSVMEVSSEDVKKQTLAILLTALALDRRISFDAPFNQGNGNYQVSNVVIGVSW